MDRDQTTYVTFKCTAYWRSNSSNPFTVINASRTYHLRNWRTTGPGYVDWKDRIAKGMYAGTTMNAGRRSLRVYPNGFTKDGVSSSGTCEVVGPRSMMDWLVPLTTVTTFDGTLVSQARDKAGTKLRSKFRDMQVAWNSGQFIGELAEAVRFVKKPLQSLEQLTKSNWRNLAQDVRRLSGKEPRLDRLPKGTRSEILRAATDSWLAYQYAAKPLVKDVQAAAGALTRYWSQQPFRLIDVNGSSRVSKRVHTWSFLNSWPEGYVGASRAAWKKDVHTRVYTRYHGKYKVQNSTNTFPLVEQLGLTPDNWLPTLWELVPYSFVIDYFSNAGEFIDAFSFQRLDFEWLEELVRQEVEHDLSNMSHRNAENGYQYEDTRNYSWGGKIIDLHTLSSRNRITSLPLPSLRLKLPGLGQDLNLAALINSSLPFRAR